MSIRLKSIPSQRRYRDRLLAFCLPLLSVLLALPATAAIDIPTDPLTTGARVPPNIMFILDNSGSMALVSMPTLPEDTNFDVEPSDYPSTGTGTGANRTGLRDDPHDRSYLNNGVYYNPAVTYRAWMSADGVTRMTGGTTANEVYSNWNLASGSTRNLHGNVESIFYVPHASVVASMSPNPADYDRYSINSSGVVVKSAYSRPSASVALPTGTYSSTSSNDVATINITVPSGTGNLQVFTTGGNARVQLDLYRPGSTTSQCTSNSGNGGESCSISSPVSGTWKAVLKRDGTGGGANFTGVRIDGLVDVQTPALPNPTRTQAQELVNIATWYSYYRTRLKTAKAGASEAFAGLSREMRVGYTPINGRSPHLSASPPSPAQAIIPVNNNNGLFEATNKSNWFTSVQSETVKDGSTPLRVTLKAVGDYYTRSDSNGPWGPGQPVSQLSCRQSFSILTTDGYWNDTGRGVFNDGGIGDSDGDGNSTTLADVAHHYYKTDLRGGNTALTNNVPFSAADPAYWQHMVTFGISIGLRGNMVVTDPPPASNSPLWTNPMNAADANRIDDLWHATVNSRGKFVAASDPDSFSRGLQAALAAIVERTGSFSNVAANSTSLDTGTRIFQANYISAVWTGELASYSFVDGVVSETPSWRASAGIPTTDRKVFTYNGTAGRLFPSQATTAQLAALTRTSSPAVTGVNNAAYIAGARNLEMNQSGGTLRNRNSLLGDIVSSSPAYVEDTETVYVGANDGMLHAVNASNGSELFAYIPNIINWGALETLSRPDYSHRYFVDGPVVVSTRKQTPDRNILVGALGKGGKGLFALDVTNPATFGVGDVLWEHNETAGRNMGLVQGEPIIAKLPTATGGTFNALIVGNGVNSSNNRSVLLVYDLASGELIREISTGAGSAGEPNGLSAPVGWDANGDGVVEYIYAGDTLGNVWKFNTAGVPNSWAVANSGNPMFVATDSAGLRQPISGRLTVALHPSNFSTWVFFGTGRFTTDGDVTNRATQALYGIRDDGVVVPRSGLIQRQTVVTGTSNSRPVRSFQSYAPLPVRTPADELVRGWYINLLEPPNQSALGERIITEAQVINRTLIAASLIPTDDACQSDGRGYINAMDAFTGTSLSKGSFFDVNNNNNFDDDTLTSGRESIPIGSVDLGVGMPTLPNLLRELAVAGGSSGGRGQIRTRDNRTSGRVSWREVVVE